MKNKNTNEKHGIVRSVNKQTSEITEACYKNGVMNGLYRHFFNDKDGSPCIAFRVYNDGEDISHQVYERNLNMISQSGELTELISDVCWPSDFKIAA